MYICILLGGKQTRCKVQRDKARDNEIWREREERESHLLVCSQKVATAEDWVRLTKRQRLQEVGGHLV